MNTIKKLKFLKENLIENQYSDFKKKFGTNIIGIRLGKKQIKGEETNRYSAIFCVSKKGEDHVENERIPKFLEVEFPKEGKKSIPTDVIETGQVSLETVQYGEKAKDNIQNHHGSLGMLITRNGYVYGCSNMHVIGDRVIQNGYSSYYMPPNMQSTRDVLFSSSTHYTHAFLEQGIFGDLDAAIARIENPTVVSNNLQGHGSPTGIQFLNYNNYIIQVKMDGAISGLQDSVVRGIGQVTSVWRSGLEAILTDLIVIDRVSTGGDSGAVVFNPFNRRIIGIIVGGDNLYSYVIPSWKILNHFNASLL